MTVIAPRRWMLLVVVGCVSFTRLDRQSMVGAAELQVRNCISIKFHLGLRPLGATSNPAFRLRPSCLAYGGRLIWATPSQLPALFPPVTLQLPSQTMCPPSCRSMGALEDTPANHQGREWPHNHSVSNGLGRSG